MGNTDIKLYSIAEAADRLSISTAKMRKIIKENHYSVVVLGERETRIKKTELEKIIIDHTMVANEERGNIKWQV